ncbi:SET methyltransferase domain containing protein [Nitzschia inconspicua]|uniref:SET methyltransferase domain containing protein n=1 Tax=Nitzschia inconspicua TaxID=303405 RepID=A0A9K3KMK4_9STRA|nr:SET methyltransferase domain containing protein [Nitzschia inconspicua]
MNRFIKVHQCPLLVWVCAVQQAFIWIHPVFAQEKQCTAKDPRSCMATKDEEFVCGLYIAKSTIPNAGLGIFTGVDHDIGDVVAPLEIAHQILLGFDGISEENNHLFGHPRFGTSLFHHYTWNSYVSGGEYEASYVETLIPGIGMASNCFAPLINSRSIMGQSIDTAGLYSSGNVGPGAGAFSAYHGMTYVADAAMEAGEEIFSDYGEAYFRGRPNVYGMIPLSNEFDKADKMTKALWEALPTETKTMKNLFQWQPTWDVIREQFVNDERTRNALPTKVEDLQRFVELGSAGFFLRGDNPRSLEWPDENGYCMDTLDIRPSSIPNAGRGAFAKKKFAAGEKILPLPLLQTSRELLQIYAGDKDDLESAEVHGHQLLLNYCFGHSKSSLLLMPYSSTASFINHLPSGAANAKVVWADSKADPTGLHQEKWMVLSVDEILEKSHSGLLMHVVATRDIAVGEEITIDYGTAWEEAWKTHEADWSMAEPHLSASELNTIEDAIRTIFEEPYPSGVATACHYRFGSTRDEKNAANNPNNQQSEGKLQIEFVERNAFQWVDHGGRGTMSGDYFRPCKVIARHSDPNEGTVYTVKMDNRPIHPEWDQIPAKYQHYVKNVPRRAILFIDEPYTSHQHYEMAFRHEIGFPNPDEMWPLAWMDLEDDEE